MSRVLPQRARASATEPAPLLRWWGWAPLLVLPAGAMLLVPQSWPGWALMWTLCVAIFVGCKWLTWWTAPVGTASFRRRAGYLFAWPGLDAQTFLEDRRAVDNPTKREWVFAAAKLLIGIGIYMLLARRVPIDWPYAVGWAGMIGIVMVLHFGLFHLLSCAWRAAGVDARPLMNWPLTSPGISEFWGRRWNTAFRDFAHRFVFAPISRRLGPKRAVAAGFLFSGLAHEMVISLPAGGGYGGPTLFFLIQGGAILVERSRLGRSMGLARGWRGWLFALAVLLIPMGLLFHRPFVVDVVVPFLAATGALQ